MRVMRRGGTHTASSARSIRPPASPTRSPGATGSRRRRDRRRAVVSGSRRLDAGHLDPGAVQDGGSPRAPSERLDGKPRQAQAIDLAAIACGRPAQVRLPVGQRVRHSLRWGGRPLDGRRIARRRARHSPKSRIHEREQSRARTTALAQDESVDACRRPGPEGGFAGRRSASAPLSRPSRSSTVDPCSRSSSKGSSMPWPRGRHRDAPGSRS
jgi:hypothetical protein